MTRARLAGAALVALALLVSSTAWAHAFRPAVLELVELDAGAFDVRFKVGGAVDDEAWVAHALLGEDAPAGASIGAEGLTPVLPERCVAVGEARVQASGAGVMRAVRVDCGAAGIDGAMLGVDGLQGEMLDVVVRVRHADGRVFTGVLDSARTTLAVPSSARPGGVWATYTALGVEHILLGADHLLFVLVLLLIVDGRRRLLGAITGFTLGHSVTLVAASLDAVRVPIAPVEAMIAVSVALLAAEAARGRGEATTLTRRHPGVASAAFGLLHGLGFSSVLGELGLPVGAERVQALLAFNVGVEFGQVAFVSALLVLAAVVRRWWPANEARVRLAVAYGAGVVATAWVFERAAAIVAG